MRHAGRIDTRKLVDLIDNRLRKGHGLRTLLLIGRGRWALSLTWETRASWRARSASRTPDPEGVPIPESSGDPELDEMLGQVGSELARRSSSPDPGRGLSPEPVHCDHCGRTVFAPEMAGAVCGGPGCPGVLRANRPVPVGRPCRGRDARGGRPCLSRERSVLLVCTRRRRIGCERRGRMGRRRRLSWWGFGGRAACRCRIGDGRGEVIADAVL